MTMKIADFWGLIPCDLVDVTFSQTTQHHIPEDSNLQCVIPARSYIIDFQLC
jgi:hypothetical protein